MGKHDWIVDVLDDLSDYCAKNELRHLQEFLKGSRETYELEKTAANVSSRPRRNRWPMATDTSKM